MFSGIGAVALAAAAVGGALIQSDAAGKAADKQSQATDKGIAEGSRQFDLTRSDSAPYRSAGISAMDQLRQLIQDMKQEELNVLEHRAASAQFGTNRTMTGLLLGSAFGVLTLALAGLMILREIRQRQEAERALQRANLQLEARVKEQTQALSSTTEELQLENIRRAKAEEAERRQREWWSVTLTSIGDAVITTDTKGRINYLNQTAQQLTGWTQAEAQGQPLAEVFRIVNEETQQPLENPVDKVLREGVAVALTNHNALFTKDGRPVPIDNSGAPIEYGFFNGAIPPDLRFGMLPKAIQEYLGQPIRAEKVETPNEFNTIERHYYKGMIVEYDLLPNGNPIMGGVVIAKDVK